MERSLIGNRASGAEGIKLVSRTELVSRSARGRRRGEKNTLELQSLAVSIHQ